MLKAGQIGETSIQTIWKRFMTASSYSSEAGLPDSKIFKIPNLANSSYKKAESSKMKKGQTRKAYQRIL